MCELSPQIVDWVQQALQSSITNIERLKGATSTTLYKIKTDSGFYVLRLYDNEDWIKREPDLPIHEAESLRLASTVPDLGLHIPQVMKVDATGEACDIPAILMGFVPGQVDLNPTHLDVWLKELARGLSEIHKINPGDFKWHYFRYNKADRLQVPNWTKHPDLWKKGIQMVQEPSPRYSETFIHRDYHPVNVLWQDGQLISVVDWVNGCRGPAAVDVSHCRNNLVCLFGVEAADIFLSYYQEYTGDAFTYDPYWDLVGYFDFTFPGPPQVYQGWIDFGLNHLTDQLITERLEHYLTTLIK